MGILFIIPAMIAATLLTAITVKNAASRGWLGGIVILSFVFALHWIILNFANKNRAANEKLNFFDLIITSEDNSFSLSRFQIYIWTVWIIFAFSQAAFATLSLPSIPANIAILMGINGFTAALSTAITDKSKLTRSPQPDFIHDIFLDDKGTIDLPRMQMFIWTIVILIGHMTSFWAGFQKHPSYCTIQDVSSGLLILMGVSNGAYLGVKAAQKQSDTNKAAAKK
jgi:hypothetical protein